MKTFCPPLENSKFQFKTVRIKIIEPRSASNFCKLQLLVILIRKRGENRLRFLPKILLCSYLSPETYTVCEEGASSIGHHHSQGFTTPVQETGDEHVAVGNDDDVEKDDAARKSGGSLQYRMQSAEEEVKKEHGETF